MKHTLKALLTTTLLTVPSVFGSAQPAKSTAAAQNATSPGGPAKGDEAPAGQLPRLPVTELTGPADHAATSPAATALVVEAEAARPGASVWPEVFGVGSNTSFKSILDNAFEKKIWTRSATDAELAALKTAINESRQLDVEQRIILTGLLPNATPYDIRIAAGMLANKGLADKAAKVYMRSASHENARSWEIRDAAFGLMDLGPAYYQSAKVIYEQLAGETSKHPKDAAYGLLWLAHSSYEESAVAAQNTSSEDAQQEANRLKILGESCYFRAIALFEQLAKNATDSFSYQDAADGFRELGGGYPIGSEERTRLHNKAEQLYDKSLIGATHRSLPSIKNGLTLLGNMYPKSSAEYVKYHAKASNVGKTTIFGFSFGW